MRKRPASQSAHGARAPPPRRSAGNNVGGGPDRTPVDLQHLLIGYGVENNCRHTRLPPIKKMARPVRLGSICAGMGVADKIAAHSVFGTSYTHAFSCEHNRHAIAMILLNHPSLITVEDAQDLVELAPPSDIVTAGFPCQPFSMAGLQEGMRDSQLRGLVIVYILRYCAIHKPRVVILENTDALLNDFPNTMIAIVEACKSLLEIDGTPLYFVTFKILNSRIHGGVPQDRKRLYIVLIRRLGRRTIAFEWPSEICMAPLSSVIDPGSKKLRSYMNYPFPSHISTAETCVVKAMTRVLNYCQRQSFHIPPTEVEAVCDAGASASSVGWGFCPTITATRGSARYYWSLQHARFLTVDEMFRLQGIDPNLVVKTGSDAQLGKRIGNSFTASVLSRVLAKAVEAAEKSV